MGIWPFSFNKALKKVTQIFASLLIKPYLCIAFEKNNLLFGV